MYAILAKSFEENISWLHILKCNVWKLSHFTPCSTQNKHTLQIVYVKSFAFPQKWQDFSTS